MGIASAYTPEKLFVGLLFHDEQNKDKAIDVLQERFGPVDYQTQVRDFSVFSSYYDEEMGGRVFRSFVSFRDLIDPSHLAEIKTWTNSLEAGWANAPLRRTINLDPGLLSVGRIALATTKNAAHRIALTSGIYVEITLFYAKKNYHPLPWTYPDFQDSFVKQALLDMRRIYMQQLKDEN